VGVAAVAAPQRAATAHLCARRDRWHILRADTALVPLPPAVRTGDTDAEGAVLVDSHTKTGLDIQPSAKWRHDTVVGLQVARRNAGDLRHPAADKGYDKNAFRDFLRENDVQPLVRHCLYTWYDYAYNARLEDSLYNKRWMTETYFSVVKRPHSATVRTQAWYREFRECVLKFAVYNIERATSAL